MFGVVPKPLWERRAPADERNRISLAMRCLLVETADATVLVDTGLGNKEDPKFLDIYGVRNDGSPTRLEDSLRGLGVAGSQPTGLEVGARRLLESTDRLEEPSQREVRARERGRDGRRRSDGSGQRLLAGCSGRVPSYPEVVERDRDAVRWLVRFHTRRVVGNAHGRELVGDVVDDLQLQRSLEVLAKELGVKLADIDGLAFVPAMLEASDKKAAEAATR